LGARQNLIPIHFSRLTLILLQQALYQSVPVTIVIKGFNIFQVLISQYSKNIVLRFPSHSLKLAAGECQKQSNFMKGKNDE